jgi:hypothetical protein
MTTAPLIDQLFAVCTELARNGWHVDPIDITAPDHVTNARLLIEERRLRAMGERQ